MKNRESAYLTHLFTFIFPFLLPHREHDKKHSKDEKEDPEHNNEDERELEKMERFEYEKQTRLAAGERLARMQENQPKNEVNNNFRQRENIFVAQPILHNHSKSGAAAQK